MGRGAERKSVQNVVFHGKRHDNKILKVNILLSSNFVVMAQAPIETVFHPFPILQNPESLKTKTSLN